MYSFLPIDEKLSLNPSERDNFFHPGQLTTPKIIDLDKPKLIRILIADDHPVVREGLVALINRRPDMTVVAEASDGQELVTKYLLHRPDVALADLRMPKMDGIEAIAAIREQLPLARLIVLTTYDDEIDIQRSMQVGAKAYMLKDTPREELVACIKAVHEGRSLIPSIIMTNLAEIINAPQLIPREIEILELIAEGKFDQEIANLLSITDSTVKKHLKTVLEKLNTSGYTQAMTNVIRQNLLQ